jgi:hypothetical protein
MTIKVIVTCEEVLLPITAKSLSGFEFVDGGPEQSALPGIQGAMLPPMVPASFSLIYIYKEGCLCV